MTERRSLGSLWLHGATVIVIIAAREHYSDGNRGQVAAGVGQIQRIAEKHYKQICCF